MELTPEEEGLRGSVETGEWQRIPDFPQEPARYRETARATLGHDKRVTLRMSERDLVRLQKTATREGLPYQTLISSILHEYTNGRLVEKTGQGRRLPPRCRRRPAPRGHGGRGTCRRPLDC